MFRVWSTLKLLVADALRGPNAGVVAKQEAGEELRTRSRDE